MELTETHRKALVCAYGQGVITRSDIVTELDANGLTADEVKLWMRKNLPRA